MKKIKKKDETSDFGIKQFDGILSTIMPNIKDWDGMRKSRVSKKEEKPVDSKPK